MDKLQFPRGRSIDQVKLNRRLPDNFFGLGLNCAPRIVDSILGNRRAMGTGSSAGQERALLSQGRVREILDTLIHSRGQSKERRDEQTAEAEETFAYVRLGAELRLNRDPGLSGLRISIRRRAALEHRRATKV